MDSNGNGAGPRRSGKGGTNFPEPPPGRERMLEGMYARRREDDGRYLVGVLSTGIYCLPSCPARKPREENVRFFPDEDEARRAGLRPCLRCRPEDFYRGVDRDRETVRRLVDEVRADPARFPDAGALAAAAGVGPTKLNLLLRDHLHLTPAAFLTGERVRGAARLLGEGRLKSIEVAFAVGFESLSSFHSNFSRATGLTPGEYARLGRRNGGGGAEHEFTLRLPRSYRPQDPLAFLGRDPDSPSERANGRHGATAVRVDGTPGVLRLEFVQGGVRCRLVARRAVPGAAVREAHGIVCRILDLGSRPGSFERRLAREPSLASLVRGRRGLRLPGTATVFEALTWAVLGQQVNVAFAAALRRALISLAGTDAGDGFIAHPTAGEVARLDVSELTTRRFSGPKADYLIGAARRIAGDGLDLECMPAGLATAAESSLRAVRGIGPWTAGYVLMRGCGFADCVPVGDAGLGEALRRRHGLERRPDPRTTRSLMEPYAPHRSLATAHLWRSLAEDPPALAGSPTPNLERLE